MVYYFQNPNSGWPMYLRSDLTVHLEDMEGAAPTPDDESDAKRYTKIAKQAKGIDEAARLLKLMAGAEDIFCGG